MRAALRRTVGIALVALAMSTLGGCVSPFSEHAKDHQEAFSRQAREVHRKWDRYFLGLDWNDPYHDWHDPSYATGPSPRSSW